METSLRESLARAAAFEAEAHRILSLHEGAAVSRVMVLDETYRRLGALSLQQDDLMKQALRCVEHELFRAAHVMAWAAFMDFLGEKLESDGLAKVRQVRPNWTWSNVAELREFVPEYQLIAVAREVGLCSKSQMRSLHGLLSKRNECAHPSDYYPELNDTLGYISDLLKRIQGMLPKAL